MGSAKSLWEVSRELFHAPFKEANVEPFNYRGSSFLGWNPNHTMPFLSIFILIEVEEENVTKKIVKCKYLMEVSIFVSAQKRVLVPLK